VDFRHDKFSYDSEKDKYECPFGFRLRYVGKDEKSGKVIRKFRCYGYGECGRSGKCTSCGKCRELCRYEHKDVLVEHRLRMRANPDAMQTRRELSEHLFGTVKRPMNMIICC